MPKTPDEIKKGLECCIKSCYRCEDACPYRDVCKKEMAFMALQEDALALIQQLQAENAEKDERIQQLEAERDAAVDDLREAVSRAALWGVDCQYCKDKGKPVFNNCNWEWRGVQKEESTC